MKSKSMRSAAIGAAVCAFLLWSSATEAKYPSHGIYAHNYFRTESPGERHPEELVVAIAVAQEMLDPSGAPQPLYFGFRYANGGDEEDKTKVTFGVEIYRGAELLWNSKRKRKADEYGDHRYVLCETYDDGLLPGDLVIFSYKFKNPPSPGTVGMIRLHALVSPRDIWEEDPALLWPLNGEFWDCG